jgi:hypothetical protein
MAMVSVSDKCRLKRGVQEVSYRGVTELLQSCYRGVTEVLQRCYRGVTEVFKKVLKRCYSVVTFVLQWRFRTTACLKCEIRSLNSASAMCNFESASSAAV